MALPTELLLVDDEEGVRMTLSLMLEPYGFKVTSAATVPEALRLISQQTFDVLIADLNIGSPGDGFTIVSAMRRTQPHVVTFILTGYPAFETALEAIRQQVDDYLIKPTEIESLVEKINSKLTMRAPAHRIQPQRLPGIIAKNQDWILEHWLAEVKKDSQISSIRISDSERKDHIPRLLAEAVGRARGSKATSEDTWTAGLHGEMRRKQGYSVPLVVREAKILQSVLGECVQQNLIAIQVSHLVQDMVQVWGTIQTELEVSVQSFLKESNDAKPSESLAAGRRNKKSRRL
jgi:YesN/AraC family two-component response regulator